MMGRPLISMKVENDYNNNNINARGKANCFYTGKKS